MCIMRKCRGSHIDLHTYYVLPSGVLFREVIVAIGGFSSETKEPKSKNLMYFGQIIVKSTQLGKIGYFSIEKGILMGV